jgi:hypothetical protein
MAGPMRTEVTMPTTDYQCDTSACGRCDGDDECPCDCHNDDGNGTCDVCGSELDYLGACVVCPAPVRS